MSVARNTLTYWVSQFGDFGLRFVVQVFIAVILGKEGRGLLAAVILANTLMMSLTNLGLQTMALYFVGKDREGLSRYHALIVWIIGLILVLDLLLLGLFGDWIRAHVFDGISWPLLALALGVLPFSFYGFAAQGMLTSLGRVRELGRAIFYCSAVCNGLNLILLGQLYARPETLVRALVAVFVLSEAGRGVIFAALLWKSGCRWAALSFDQFQRGVREMLAYGLRAFVGNFASVLVHRSEEPFILAGLGRVGLGVYGIAARLSELIFQPSAAFESGGYARIVSSDRRSSAAFVQDLFRTNFLTNLVGLAILGIAAKPFVLLFYSEEYRDAITPLRILLLSSLFQSGSRMLALYFSAQLGRPEIPSTIAWITAGFNVPALWWAVIHKGYGMMGAATVSTASFAIMLACYIVLFSLMSHLKNPLWLFIPQRRDFARAADLAAGVIKRRSI